MDSKNIIFEFKKRGYVELPFLFSQEYFDEAMKSFVEVLELDQNLKDSVTSNPDSTTSFDATGFVLREGKKKKDSTGFEIKEDNKEFFQYNHDFKDRVPRHIINSNSKLKRFIEYAQEIYLKGEDVIRDSVKKLNSLYPGLYDSYFPKEENNSFIKLRFLAYYSEGEGEFLARAHADLGALTLAFAESSKGLRMTTKGELKEISHREGNVLLFPGAYFNKYIDSSIEPTIHDVVQKSENRINEKIARLAIVMFSAPAKPLIITPRDAREKAESELSSH